MKSPIIMKSICVLFLWSLGGVISYSADKNDFAVKQQLEFDKILKICIDKHDCRNCDAKLKNVEVPDTEINAKWIASEILMDFCWKLEESKKSVLVKHATKLNSDSVIFLIEIVKLDNSAEMYHENAEVLNLAAFVKFGAPRSDKIIIQEIKFLFPDENSDENEIIHLQSYSKNIKRDEINKQTLYKAKQFWGVWQNVLEGYCSNIRDIIKHSDKNEQKCNGKCDDSAVENEMQRLCNDAKFNYYSNMTSKLFDASGNKAAQYVAAWKRDEFVSNQRRLSSEEENYVPTTNTDEQKKSTESQTSGADGETQILNSNAVEKLNTEVKKPQQSVDSSDAVQIPRKKNSNMETNNSEGENLEISTNLENEKNNQKSKENSEISAKNGKNNQKSKENSEISAKNEVKTSDEDTEYDEAPENSKENESKVTMWLVKLDAQISNVLENIVSFVCSDSKKIDSDLFVGVDEHLEIIGSVISLYENVISKYKNIKDFRENSEIMRIEGKYCNQLKKDTKKLHKIIKKQQKKYKECVRKSNLNGENVVTNCEVIIKAKSEEKVRIKIIAVVNLQTNKLLSKITNSIISYSNDGSGERFLYDHGVITYVQYFELDSQGQLMNMVMSPTILLGEMGRSYYALTPLVVLAVVAVGVMLTSWFKHFGILKRYYKDTEVLNTLSSNLCSSNLCDSTTAPSYYYKLA